MNWVKIEQLSKTVSGICIVVIVLCLFIKLFTGYAYNEPVELHESKTTKRETNISLVCKNEIIEEANNKLVEEKKAKEEEEKKKELEGRKYIEFVATAYCACEKCCGKWALNRPNGIVKGAAGRELISNYSVAVDPKVIPYGTILYDESGNSYRADDCGGAVKGYHIDIYMDSHNAARNFGKQTMKLYW